MKIIEKMLIKEIVGPIVVILVAILLSKIVKKITKKIFKRLAQSQNKKQQTVLSLINNVIKFVIWAIGCLVILSIFGVNTTSLLASLGVVGLIVGLALQDILKDLIAGISIIFDNQYIIGEIVEINGFKGEVIELGLRITKIKAYTGEIKMISNRNIIEVINYSISSNVAVVDIPVAYESDIKKTYQVLAELCNQIKEEYNFKSVECLGVQEIADSAIVFRMVATSKTKQNFESARISRIIKKEAILALNKHKIDIPYQQVVVHNAK